MISETLLKSLIGLNEEALSKVASEEKFEVQVISNDGESFMTDMMVRDDRVKVELTEGLVSKAYIG